LKLSSALNIIRRLTNVGKSIFAKRELFLANLDLGKLTNLEPTPDEYRRATQQEKEHLLATGSSPITSADSTVTKLALQELQEMLPTGTPSPYGFDVGA
jgi:hypothetical protein